ncbi:unnamed protein product, partial [Linum tenue]
MKEAVSKGGSSNKNINEFVNSLICKEQTRRWNRGEGTRFGSKGASE